MDPIQLTPFEEQVMQAIQARLDWDSFPSGSFYDSCIQYQGSKLFDSSWGGRSITNRCGVRMYPLVHRFFGRLQAKGLLQRHDNGFTSLSNSGYWNLTPLGQEFLGFSNQIGVAN